MHTRIEWAPKEIVEIKLKRTKTVRKKKLNKIDNTTVHNLFFFIFAKRKGQIEHDKHVSHQ